MAWATYVTGKGFRERNPPYHSFYVFGAELGSVDLTGWYSPVDIVDPTTNFDLSTISKYHEVIAALVNVVTDGPYSLTFNLRFYRDRDNALLYERTVFQSATYAWEQSCCGWIGWCDSEIMENGAYHVDITVTGTHSFNYTLHFTVSGMPAVITPPSPVTPFVDAIFSAVWDARDYVYAAWSVVNTWVWPLCFLAAPLYAVYVVTGGLLTGIANFGDWVRDVATKVTNIINARDIIKLLQSWLTYAEDAWSWVSNHFRNVWDDIVEGWPWVYTQVKSWIDFAIQGLPQLITAWGNFWTVTLPTLISSNGLAQWWNDRLLDIDTLLNSAFTTRQSLWSGWQEMKARVEEFFTDPVGFIWDRFTDWFLGPE